MPAQFEPYRESRLNAALMHHKSIHTVDNLRENFPPWSVGGQIAWMTSGQVNAVLVPCEPNYTCTQMTLLTGGTAFTVGSSNDSHLAFGAYDLFGNLLASSTDEAPFAWGGNTVKTKLFTSAAVVPDGHYGFYAAVGMVLGTGGVPVNGTHRSCASAMHSKITDGASVPGHRLLAWSGGAYASGSLPATITLAAAGAISGGHGWCTVL